MFPVCLINKRSTSNPLLEFDLFIYIQDRGNEWNMKNYPDSHNTMCCSTYCSKIVIGSLVEIVPRVAARAERCPGVNVQIDRVVPLPLHR